MPKPKNQPKGEVTTTANFNQTEGAGQPAPSAGMEGAPASEAPETPPVDALVGYTVVIDAEDKPVVVEVRESDLREHSWEENPVYETLEQAEEALASMQGTVPPVGATSDAPEPSPDELKAMHGSHRDEAGVPYTIKGISPDGEIVLRPAQVGEIPALWESDFRHMVPDVSGGQLTENYADRQKRLIAEAAELEEKAQLERGFVKAKSRMNRDNIGFGPYRYDFKKGEVVYVHQSQISDLVNGGFIDPIHR